MNTPEFFSEHKMILTEAAVVEALAHETPHLLHPDLFNAPMAGSEDGQAALRRLYRSFYAVAADHGLPFLLTTPTWRASRDRVQRAGAPEDINETAVSFLQQVIQDIQGEEAICLGGLLGCKNDCYRPDQGLDTRTARMFHAWQADRLSRAGADLLMAVTLPAFDEALGMAMAMADTGTPYIISFVINREGKLLDGTGLARAVDRMDSTLPAPPAGYMVNCAHPSFLRPDRQPKALFSRLIGFQANASSLDHDQLDNAPAPKADDIKAWGDQMLRLNREFGLRILGGCCGTRKAHLEYIAQGVAGAAD